MLLPNHRIKRSHLDLLCRGSGSAELTAALWRTELSRRLLLFHSVVDLVKERPELLAPLPDPADSVDLLKDIDDSDQAMFRELLLHPQVGSWAAYVMRRERGLVRTETPFWVDVGALHALAFVAAVRQGRAWSTTVPARDGGAMFPGLGMAVFATSQTWGRVEAETSGHEVTLRCEGHCLRISADGRSWSGDAQWWELGRLSVGADLVLTVTIDDIDPFRDLGDPVSPQRLSAADRGRWAALLADAWDVLCTGHRASAQAMAGGVVTLVPLADGGGTETRSASTGEAFGSVLVSEPGDAMSMAVALIHEFAHIRLGGLLHLLPVTSVSEQEIRYAPWRDDPRPLPGLVQGIYAFVNISAFWRTQAGATRLPAHEFEYALSRLQVEQALREAAGSGALTEFGEHLVGGLADRVARWEWIAATESSFHAAALVVAAHRTGWRLRHLRPATKAVDRLVAAWCNDEKAPILDPGYSVVAGARRWSSGRLALARRWVTHGHATLTDRLRALGADEADADLLRGERAAAAAAFTSRILADPDDLDAWSGLGLAVDGPAAVVLREHPALVRAVHRGAGGAGQDPVTLAHWLAGGEQPSAPVPVLPDDVGKGAELP
jgi:HEXXH motif-containing protein